MKLLQPEWLALLPVLLLLGWWLPQLGLLRPLRILLLLLVTLVLTEPKWQRFADGLDLWVLVDSSASAEEPMVKSLNETEQLLEKGRGREDRLFFLHYANEVMRRGAEGAELYERDRHHTRTELAVTQALALAQKEGKDKPARILVLSDGYATEPLTSVAAKLVRQGVELDYRLVRQAESVDYRIAGLEIPARAQLGEPFLLEVQVRGTQDGKVPLVVRRNGQEMKRTEVELHLGRGQVRLTDRMATAGVARYEVVIEPKTDAYSGNNRYEAMIEITGGPRVLLLTRYQDDPVATVLRQQGFAVEVVSDLISIRPGQLAGAKCVILNNVPAYELPPDFLPAMDFYVREQGGSLLMAGGKHSFAAGGYFESPIDPLLPVSMEMKQEHRKLMVAMAIVMDRSGSMGMTVQNGFTKMALADEGAANAIRFLGPQDLLSVFAVDSEPHPVVPLQPVGPNREKMESAVRRIESMGGGIFVYAGLKAAWDELKTAPVGQRHIILFSDAADSEEPGDYRKLLAEVTQNGGTVSVIALGTRGDVDAALLEDIAKLGKGRLFFTDKAEELPSIFSQETIAVARSAFLKDPVPTQAAGGWFEISGQPLEWLKKADGYNLSYLRDWASQALVTSDEYVAPLVSFGHRGIGRTVAVSFPLGGEHSALVRAWPKYGDFLQTIVRWAMGETVPPGVGIKHRLAGNTLMLELLHDPEWEERLAASPPRLMLAQGARAENVQEIAWERVAPGHYTASQELKEGVMARGAVQLGKQALTFGPLMAGSSAEWAFDEERARELRQVSLASGGRELLELGQAWRSPHLERFVSLSLPLLLLILALLLVDALVTRMGWRLPVWARQARVRSSVVKPFRKPREPARPTVAPASPTSVTPTPQAKETDVAATSSEERRARFSRAKKR